jgi:hypothetical protein
MHHRSLSVFPHAESSDEVHRHARIHRKGAIDIEQRTPLEGAVMPPLWRAPMNHDHHRVQMYGDVHSRWRRCDPTCRSAYFGTKGFERPHTTGFSRFPRERKQDLLVQHRIYRLPICESVNVTRNASNRNSPWRSN